MLPLHICWFNYRKKKSTLSSLYCRVIHQMVITGKMEENRVYVTSMEKINEGFFRKADSQICIWGWRHRWQQLDGGRGDEFGTGRGGTIRSGKKSNCNNLEIKVLHLVVWEECREQKTKVTREEKLGNQIYKGVTGRSRWRWLLQFPACLGGNHNWKRIMRSEGGTGEVQDPRSRRKEEE